jgi:S-adenosylmethionine:tRNA ribosyltransferase-isomerase
VYSLSDYNYHLPEERIAQKPSDRRDRSKLLRLNRETGSISHHTFFDIAELLSPSDVLIINNTQVIPGRLIGKKATGGRAEVLILDYEQGKASRGEQICRCLVKASKRPGNGARLFFDQGLEAEIMGFQDGIHTVKFLCPGRFEDALYRIGKMPLPPYIRRENGTDAPCDDAAAYQTVYASQKGAIAAPTAGLHFSEALLDRIRDKGIAVAAITLHVGYGTFLPVRVSDIREHRMHSERYFIPESSANLINQAKAAGRRVIATGTTCVRTLEYSADNAGNIRAGSGTCDLFIYPGYAFKITDGMITNFHLPESTLLMLVSAFAGRENIFGAYQEAIRNKYRFYSYGDAMLIE